MRVIVEYLVERTTFAGETEELGENLPQRHFVHQKSHMTRSGFFSVLTFLHRVDVSNVADVPPIGRQHNLQLHVVTTKKNINIRY
jgi:hypothetical protein